jgi:hypothetical protein
MFNLGIFKICKSDFLLDLYYNICKFIVTLNNYSTYVTI